MHGTRLRLFTVPMAMALLASAYVEIPPTPLMRAAAERFLNSLSEKEKAAAVFTFEDDERFFWHFIPADDIPKRYNRPRRGLPLKDMNRVQSTYAHALLASGLSATGYQKATGIIALEEILKEIERDSGERRNPGKYFFSIFGAPSGPGPWGLRVEGHHLSLHYTVVGGRMVASPTFFGSNPHEVRQGPHKGMRILAREEDLGRAVLLSLTPDQRRTAVVAEKAYADILTSASRKASIEGQPAGLAAVKMTAAQRRKLEELLEEYVSNLPDSLAAHRRDQIRAAGANLHFAWAGVAEKGGPHYYRIQAPAFLVEYDNTQNAANHVHSVWRDYKGDWGEDLLARHYEASHKK